MNTNFASWICNFSKQYVKLFKSLRCWNDENSNAGGNCHVSSWSELTVTKLHVSRTQQFIANDIVTYSVNRYSWSLEVLIVLQNNKYNSKLPVTKSKVDNVSVLSFKLTSRFACDSIAVMVFFYRIVAYLYSRSMQLSCFSLF